MGLRDLFFDKDNDSNKTINSVDKIDDKNFFVEKEIDSIMKEWEILNFVKDKTVDIDLTVGENERPSSMSIKDIKKLIFEP